MPSGIAILVPASAGCLELGPSLREPPAAFALGRRARLAPVDSFEVEVGKGVKCTVDNVAVHMGNRRCLSRNGIDVSPGTFDAMKYLEEKGQTAVAVSINGRTEVVCDRALLVLGAPQLEQVFHTDQW